MSIFELFGKGSWDSKKPMFGIVDFWDDPESGPQTIKNVYCRERGRQTDKKIACVR